MPSTRDMTFSRVTVDYAMRGNARITWSLRPEFRDLAPHTFQLQVNRNGGDPGSEWQDVGTSADNVNFAIDDQQRLYGKQMRIVYRVELTTSQGVYYSGVATVLGLLSKRQWLQLRAMRRRLLLFTRQMQSFDGFLMKRKIYGTPCPDCLDPFTGGITDSDCATCQGTGKVAGYWRAADNTMYDLSPEAKHSNRGNALKRGTVNDIVHVAKCVGLPLINSRDVWIDAASDRRYIVRRVTHTSELNQIPVAATVELRLAEATDEIYNISLEGN